MFHVCIYIWMHNDCRFFIWKLKIEFERNTNKVNQTVVASRMPIGWTCDFDFQKENNEKRFHVSEQRYKGELKLNVRRLTPIKNNN